MADAVRVDARPGGDEPANAKEGADQENLQALLANIFTRQSDDGTSAGLANSTGTRGGSSLSGPSTTASDGPSFVSALLSHQAAPSDSPRTDAAPSNDNGVASLLRALQAKQSTGQAQNQPNALMSLLKSQGQPAQPAPVAAASNQQSDAASIDNLVSSFLAVNQQEKQQQQGGNDILAQLLQSQQVRKPETNAPPSGSNTATTNNNSNLIQQLLLAKLQQQQQQQQSQDILAKLLGSQQQQQQPAAQPSPSGGGMLADLLGSAAGSGLGGLSSEEPSPGLGDLVNQVLSTRGKAKQAEAPQSDVGLLQPQGDPSLLSQHSADSTGTVKRKADSELDIGNSLKLQKLVDSEASDEARHQHLNKLRDQLKNLNSANVMLSRYLGGLQSSLSDILAENWSFKILIGCLTSKAESSNPLEQMISARIASNPTVAIPMLKNIHRTATANAPEDQLEVNSSKNAVFENMVGLLSAQKKANTANS